jgi:hypothetical protein
VRCADRSRFGNEFIIAILGYEHEFHKEVLAADFVLDSISDYKIAEDHEQYRVYKGDEFDGQVKTVFIV